MFSIPARNSPVIAANPDAVIGTNTKKCACSLYGEVALKQLCSNVSVSWERDEEVKLSERTAPEVLRAEMDHVTTVYVIMDFWIT